MKRYKYPAVLHRDTENESYTLFFPDLDLVAQGENAEDCYDQAKKILKNYFEVASKFSTFVPEPTPYDDVIKNNPDKIVIMADTDVDDKKMVLSDSDKEYKDFMKMFFDVE